jgi:large subunit ribosomal protein L25
MREVAITAVRRETGGKGPARRQRMGGNVPAIVYGPGIEPFPISLVEKDLRAAMKSSVGAGTIYNLNVEGKENKVILREMQRDPVTCRIIHLDFHAISMTKPLKVSIPIHFIGTPMGVKTEGGIMQMTMRELEISCLPTAIPEFVEVDVTNLGIGDSIHVRDLKLENITVVSPGERTLVVIAAPTIIKEAVPVAAEGEAVAAAEGEAAAAEGAEPAEAAEGDKAKADKGKAEKPKADKGKGDKSKD